MNILHTRPAIALSGLLVMAALSAPASAGHLNTVLKAELDGREEVSADSYSKAKVGDRNGRGEAYVFGIDNNPMTLCYTIVGIKKLDEVDMAPGNGRAAHIHEGERGSNGPVVANLAWPQDGQAGDCISETTQGKFPTGENGIVQRILANPANFYINLHNSVHPNGAIRGQLEDTADHRHK